MVQPPQSCLSTTPDVNGNLNLTVIAAVRSTVPSPTVDLTVTVPSARPSGVVVPALITTNVNMVALNYRWTVHTL